MSTRALGVVLVGGLGVIGTFAFRAVPWLLLPLSLALVGVWLAAGRCWHRDVSLLPPVPDGGPDRDHARWLCANCLRTWPVALGATARPRRIYTGFDPSKAVEAAARADAFEHARRRLAVVRAGMTVAPHRMSGTSTGTHGFAGARPGARTLTLTAGRVAGHAPRTDGDTGESA